MTGTILWGDASPPDGIPSSEHGEREGEAGAPVCGSGFARGGGDTSPVIDFQHYCGNLSSERELARGGGSGGLADGGGNASPPDGIPSSEHGEREGEAPRALPEEGATRAPHN